MFVSSHLLTFSFKVPYLVHFFDLPFSLTSLKLLERLIVHWLIRLTGAPSLSHSGCCSVIRRLALCWSERLIYLIRNTIITHLFFLSIFPSDQLSFLHKMSSDVIDCSPSSSSSSSFSFHLFIKPRFTCLVQSSLISRLFYCFTDGKNWAIKSH